MQPTLMSYTFSGPPAPVLLDVASVKPDSILLLDTFFHVIVWHGEVIGSWRDAGYQELPEHVLFRTMLQQPKDDAQVRCRVVRRTRQSRARLEGGGGWGRVCSCVCEHLRVVGRVCMSLPCRGLPLPALAGWIASALVRVHT